jgi:chemosensory pili system protein ChpC
MLDNNEIVRCILIPIGCGQLLLPSAVVAEISPYHEPKEIINKNGVLGIIDWSNKEVPLLSVEEALSLAPPFCIKKYQNLILYGLETIPYYAIRATDMPRSLTVKSENLIELEHHEDDNGFIYKVKYESEEAWLPNLSYLETIVTQAINYND